MFPALIKFLLFSELPRRVDKANGDGDGVRERVSGGSALSGEGGSGLVKEVAGR